MVTLESSVINAFACDFYEFVADPAATPVYQPRMLNMVKNGLKVETQFQSPG